MDSPVEQKMSAPDTFCIYLAKQLIAKKSYSPGVVPEAELLAQHCDVVLSHFDGMGLTIIGMIDREANPGKTFNLSAATIEEIGQACLKYSGEVNKRKIPVHIQILEVGPARPDARQRLAPYKPGSLYGKVMTSAWTIDPAAGALWTNARFGGVFLGAKFIRRLFKAPRETSIEQAPQVAALHNPSNLDWLTYSIIAALSGVFAAELLLGSWTGALQPTIATLVAFGGLARPLVQAGEWYRLFSAPLLHADIFHLALNCVVIWLAGRALENLIGRAWFATIFVIGALGGALFSLALNPDHIITVGASGAVTALFAATLVLSFHFPRGPARTGLILVAAYVLIPALLPLALLVKGQNVDYAAHFGGALGGTLLGFLMLALWPASEPYPRWRNAAALVAIAGLVLFAWSLLPVVKMIRI